MMLYVVEYSVVVSGTHPTNVAGGGANNNQRRPNTEGPTQPRTHPPTGNGTVSTQSSYQLSGQEKPPPYAP